MSKKKKIEEQSDLDLIEEINENINLWLDYSKDNVDRGQKDKRFLYVNQWDEAQLQELNRLQKPILTFNKTYDIIRKVIAEQRNNKTQFRVSSLLGLSSEDELNVFKGAVTKIATDSDSSSIFDKAYDDAASSGFGAWRVYADYEHESSLNQLPKLAWIPDPEKCFWDTSAVNETMSDSAFCGYFQFMGMKKFKSLYPEIEDPKSFDGYFKDSGFKWIDKNNIAIVEYFKQEWFATEKYQLANGSFMFKESYNDLIKSNPYIQNSIGYEVLKKENAKDFKIKYYKVIKGKILEKGDWLIKRMPIVRVVCDLHRIDGKEHILSLVSFVKDAQKFHNIVKVEVAQAIQYNRREQWMASRSSITADSLEVWKNPSIQQGVLLYDYDERGGKPEKLFPSEISQTLVEQSRISELDIQSILGLYESNLGAPGNELSGKAIRERRTSGMLSAAVLNDNFEKAVQETGKIIADLLQKLVDNERRISIKLDDGAYKDVIVNKNLMDGSKEFDFSKDAYDIVIDKGPSFAIQKADSLEVLTNLVRINPEIFPYVADIFGENIDINGGGKLKERLREFVPEAIKAKEEGRELPPPPPDPMQQILQEQINVQQQEVQVKAQKNQLEAELQAQKQRMEMLIQQQKSAIEEMKMMVEMMRVEQEKRRDENNKVIEEMKFNASLAQSSAKALSANKGDTF